MKYENIYLTFKNRTSNEYKLAIVQRILYSTQFINEKKIVTSNKPELFANHRSTNARKL